jgi:arylsulfatase
MLPTNHGFDEFFGNLYHLNAEEEPEMDNYPEGSEVHEHFGPRGVIHSWATDKDDTTGEPRWGKVGKQKIKDTGRSPRSGWKPATTSSSPPQGLHQAPEKAGKPWFVWLNTTHMHLFTHTKPRASARPASGSRRITTR